jgi:ribosomal protein S18 acetylase RimI-like enzyme
VKLDVDTRAVSLPDDLAFLQLVYASTREQDLRLLGWSADDPAGREFLRMQFEAQARHYAHAWAKAHSMVVLANGQPAGRFITDRSLARIHIVDISLLPGFRGLGVGGTLVSGVLRDADAASLPVACEVATANSARGFWEHLGFRTRNADSAYVTMERVCEISPR